MQILSHHHRNLLDVIFQLVSNSLKPRWEFSSKWCYSTLFLFIVVLLKGIVSEAILSAIALFHHNKLLLQFKLLYSTHFIISASVPLSFLISSQWDVIAMSSKWAPSRAWKAMQWSASLNGVSDVHREASNWESQSANDVPYILSNWNFECSLLGKFSHFKRHGVVVLPRSFAYPNDDLANLSVVSIGNLGKHPVSWDSFQWSCPCILGRALYFNLGICLVNLLSFLFLIPIPYSLFSGQLTRLPTTESFHLVGNGCGGLQLNCAHIAVWLICCQCIGWKQVMLQKANLP